MSDSDTDDELLSNLLASANEPPTQSTDNDSSQKINNIEKSQGAKPPGLKELDFLDDIPENFFVDETPPIKPSVSQSLNSQKEDNNADSSDEEDKKYFHKQNYSDYGREIKHLLKNNESIKESSNFSYRKENSFSGPSNSSNNSQKIKRTSSQSSSLIDHFNNLENDKHMLSVSTSSINSIKKDVYHDPIFGLKIIKPLISSTELRERMNGRKAVTVSNVKNHTQSMSISDQDWVIAGVLISQHTKTSQKGNTFSIWKISDLSMDMKKVTIFLFSSAYKTFWKTSVGSVIGILNPSILESKDDQDLATLSVDNAQKIMILGTSKDLGVCKSKKKNGDPCTAPVNLSQCEFCVYHVKQEYGKYSNKRSELQTGGGVGPFGNSKRFPNKLSSSQQRHPEALPFVAIPAKRNEAQHKKDCERLALLRGESKPEETTRTEAKIKPALKMRAYELSSNQAKKDYEKLTKLRASNANNLVNSSPSQVEKKVDLKLSALSPQLGAGSKGNLIDFSQPISKSQMNRARLNALQFVKQNGKFEKQNPNKIRPDKQVANERGIKRRREEEEKETKAEEKKIKEIAVKSRFQEMLEKKSAHADLIEKHHDEQAEKYFNKLEVKEKMEEKMLNTFKVDCKAVRCNICKYVAFSSSDLCKTLNHPIKVIDAVKRFYKCSDCGNRTVTLDRIPTITCTRCSGSKWVKTAMMDEKRTQITHGKLCIRGGEEKYIGSDISDASLNLLVPEAE